METWGKLAAAALTLTATPVVAEWKYSETADAMTDAKYARVFAAGVGGRLGVKCDAPGVDSLYLHFVADEYLGGKGGDPQYRTLMIRFDQEAPLTQTWSFDGHSAMLSRSIDVAANIERLKTATKVAIRAEDFLGHEVNSVIDVSGAAAAIAQVSVACGAKSQ